MKKIFCIILMFFWGAFLFAENLTDLFESRSKSIVCVRGFVNYEEHKRPLLFNATLVNNDNIIVAAPESIPDVQLDMLSDFKVFIEEGDSNGYPAEYMGQESLYGGHFFKVKGSLPKTVSNISQFKRGDFKTTNKLWGIMMTCSDGESYTPSYLESYVEFSEKRISKDSNSMKCALFKIGSTKSGATGLGCPVFDFDGSVAGFGISTGFDSYIMQFNNPEDNNSNVLEVNLGSLYRAKLHIGSVELDEMISNIPPSSAGNVYGWAGFVDLKPVTKEVGKFLGIPENKCAFVIGHIIENSPAGKAGIKSGDIILALNGNEFLRYRTIGNSEDFITRFLIRSKAGDKLNLKIVSGADSPRNVEIVLGNRPKELKHTRHHYCKKLGFSVREFILADALARNVFDGKTDGAIVQFVKPNGPASSALPSPLFAGYKIKEINNTPVSDYDSVIALLKKFENDSSVKELVILAEGYNDTKLVRIKLD